jgi:hypothetical protein
MDELVKLISKKTGLSAEKATTAVETVVGYLKGRLPAPVAGQIDGILAGGQAAKGLGGIANSLGGLPNKK